jgi:hypothetical protein
MVSCLICVRDVQIRFSIVEWAIVIDTLSCSLQSVELIGGIVRPDSVRPFPM